MHYSRLRKTGDPTRTKFQPLPDRFSANVERTEGGCYRWTGALNENGYGVLSTTDGWPRLAHRLSYELAHGKGSAKGMMVCHSCDNPPCVNPLHLFLGTNLDNVRDMQAKGRVSHSSRLTGAAHSQAVLSEAQVRNILDARAAGAKVKDLAATYEVSRSAIDRITNRRAWRHLKECT